MKTTIKLKKIRKSKLMYLKKRINDINNGEFEPTFPLLQLSKKVEDEEINTFYDYIFNILDTKNE